MNQSPQYEFAMITGMVEYWLEFFFLPMYLFLNSFHCSLRNSTITFWIGFLLCLCGELLRACGEIQLGHNFNHRIETSKSTDHQLITNGLYSVFRHPAYTGWFYFSIGTQVLLMNPLCTIAYTIASWYFFYVRIPYLLLLNELIIELKKNIYSSFLVIMKNIESILIFLFLLFQKCNLQLFIAILFVRHNFLSCVWYISFLSILLIDCGFTFAFICME